ncbi:MAG: penicillin-binding protein 2 [Candidatus Paceibacterota bacterium]
MKSTLISRARLLCALFIAVAMLLIIRLYFVQIVRGSSYARDAQSQYVETAPDTEERGDIYFSTKNGGLVAAAVMQSGWRIAIVPKTIQNAEDIFSRLNSITPIDEARFMASAGKTDDPYEEIAFRVTDAAGAKIRAMKLPGVLLVQDQWRNYPGGILAAQTIGFVGYQGDRKVGVYGLEREWQSTLSQTSSGLYVNPFAEIFTNVQNVFADDPASREGSIVTSIEPTVQSQLEKTLDGVMKTYATKLAGGIVMDPHTGEIVAMALRPTFDPNTYNLVTNSSVFDNPLVEGRYELGSIMKPLTMAIGIDSKVVTPETTYNDTGCMTRSNKKVCNYDFKARGVVPMQEVLNQSLNLGATFVADKTGHSRFTLYMRSLGFDQKTNIDLPGEISGTLSTLGEGKGPDVNYATASFGQGVAVTPIEMIRALATLANDGVLPNPHTVTGIRFDSGITRALTATTGPRVFEPGTVTTVSNMLVKVYDDALLKGALKMDHYSIAAKTGTAQIAIPGGGYHADRFLHSFFGYFPAYDPQFIVFLFAVEPHGAEFASATLAHPFDDIAKFLINYYDVPPDR